MTPVCIKISSACDLLSTQIVSDDVNGDRSGCGLLQVSHWQRRTPSPSIFSIHWKAVRDFDALGCIKSLVVFSPLSW